MLYDVDHGDVGIDFHLLPIQDCGPIEPLTHRVFRRLIEDGVACDNLKGLNGAVGGDPGAFRRAPRGASVWLAVDRRAQRDE